MCHFWSKGCTDFLPVMPHAASWPSNSLVQCNQSRHDGGWIGCVRACPCHVVCSHVTVHRLCCSQSKNSDELLKYAYCILISERCLPPTYLFMNTSWMCCSCPTSVLKLVFFIELLEYILNVYVVTAHDNLFVGITLRHTSNEKFARKGSLVCKQ